MSEFHLQSNPYDQFHLIPNQLNRRQSILEFEMVRNVEIIVNQAQDQPKPSQTLEPDSKFVWNGAKILRLDYRPISNWQKPATVNSCRLVWLHPMHRQCRSNVQMSVEWRIIVPSPMDIVVSQTVGRLCEPLLDTINNANLAISTQIHMFSYKSYMSMTLVNCLPSFRFHWERENNKHFIQNIFLNREVKQRVLPLMWHYDISLHIFDNFSANRRQCCPFAIEFWWIDFFFVHSFIRESQLLLSILTNLRLPLQRIVYVIYICTLHTIDHVTLLECIRLMSMNKLILFW